MRRTTLLKGALTQLKTALTALEEAVVGIDIEWMLRDVILNVEEELERSKDS